MAELIATTNIPHEHGCLYFLKKNPENNCLDIFIVRPKVKETKNEKG